MWAERQLLSSYRTVRGLISVQFKRNHIRLCQVSSLFTIERTIIRHLLIFSRAPILQYLDIGINHRKKISLGARQCFD